LLERETIDGSEMDRLLKGEKLEPIQRHDDGSASAPVTPVVPTETPAPSLGSAFGAPPPAPRPAGA
jgi:hypothetical protein